MASENPGSAESYAALLAFIDARLNEDERRLNERIRAGTATRADGTQISDLRPTARDRESPSPFQYILAARWSSHPDYRKDEWG